ncbi:MarR family transcriptional regulator [Azospirillum sp. sgz301742]
MSTPATRKLCKLALAFQRLLDKKPIQYVVILAHVNNRPGISFQDLVVLSDLSRSTVARIVDWYVSEGLMAAPEMPEDRRHKVAYLTAEGAKVMNDIADMVS